MTIRLVPSASAPRYSGAAGEMFSNGWPEFIFHDSATARYLGRRSEYFGDLDFYLLDGDRLVGGCWAVPIGWDGTVGDLPAGYTDALARAVTGRENGLEPDTLVVMAAAIAPSEQGRGLAGEALLRLRSVASDRELDRVIAPVRPTLKGTYPLTPIETYAAWTRPDGKPFDPWIRTHSRLGATILAPAPRSQTITGTVAEWETWTGMALPSPGQYVIPGGLAVLHVSDGVGVYHEPNVWMRHR